MKTIVVGLGNPILGDDSVGWRIGERVADWLQRQRLEQPDSRRYIDIEVDCLSVGGLTLMERLVGFQRAILVDAIASGDAPIGQVRSLSIEQLSDYKFSYTRSTHDTTLPEALEIGRRLGADLPERIDVLAVEILPDYRFTDTLTEPVAAAVAQVERMLLELIFKGG